MKDFWVGPWLHCAPEQRFAGGRRADRFCVVWGDRLHTENRYVELP